MSGMTPMQSAVTGCMSALGLLRFFPSDEVSRMGVMLLLEEFARSPSEAARFRVALVRHAGNEWLGPEWLRALWCRHIGTPRDGKWAELPTELVGEQHDKALPFAGCGRCESGWIHRQVVRGGVTYPFADKCDCRVQAEIAAPAPPAVAPGGKRRGLERVDARMLVAEGGN